MTFTFDSAAAKFITRNLDWTNSTLWIGGTFPTNDSSTFACGMSRRPCRLPKKEMVQRLCYHRNLSILSI